MSDNTSNTLNLNSVGKVIARKTANDNVNMPIPFLKKTGSSPQNLFIDTPNELYYNPSTRTLHADNFSGGIPSLIEGEAIQLTTSNNSTEIDVNFSKNTEVITTTFDNTDTFLVSNTSNALKTITGLKLSNQLRAGLCPLNSSNIIPNQYLPSSVSDILEVANFAALPSTGDSSKIYVTLDNHKAYRWGGTEYVEISASLVIGTTAGTAYDGASGQSNATAIANKQATITPGSNLSFSGDTLNVDSALIGITAVQATSNDLQIKTTTNNEIQFKTNNTERLSIDSTKLDSSVDINIPINKHYQINGVDVLHNTGSTTNIILNAKFIQNSVSPYDGLYINYLAGTTNTSHCRLYAGTTTPRMMIKADTGKIGIATESPSEILDVVGNIKCSGVYKGVELSSTNVDLTINTTTNNDIVFEQNNTVICKVGSTGFTCMSGKKFFGDGSELTGIDDTTYLLGNNLSFNTATTPHTINLDTTLTGLSSVTSTEIIGGDGTAGIVGQLQIVRPFTQADTTHYISCVRQGSAIFGIGYHAGGGNKIYLANSAGNNSSTTGITIDSNKIGINQVSPTQALDVNGSINIGASSSYYFNGTKIIYTTGYGPQYNCRIIANESATASLQDGMYINYNSTGGNTAHCRFYANSTIQRMHIDASTGRVGIANNSPAYKLDVSGDCNITGTYRINDTPIINTDTTYNNGTNITIGSNKNINLDASLTGLSSVTSTNFTGALNGNSSTATKITSITNSNIVQLTSTQTLTNKTLATPTVTGTMTAASATLSGTLEVTGNIKKGTVDIIYGNPTNPYINMRVLQNISTANQDGMFINYNSTGGSAADLRFYANGTTERMKIAAATGNVGIGKTAASNRKLDVDGAISSESGYKLNGISCLYNIGTEEGVGPYLNARVIANNSSLNDDGLHLNYGSTGGTDADIRLYNGSNVVKARLDSTDGTFQVVEPLLFNPPNGIAGAGATNGTFTATPNIKIGSAYMYALSGTSGTFERLMSYTKIGNMISINGYFVMNITASTGTTYMNLADLGLPLGVDTGVYPMTSQSTYFTSSISTDTSSNRLVFAWSSSTTGIKYAAVKYLFGCGFRASY